MSDLTELEALLSEVFRESVSVEGDQRHEQGDAELSIVEMGYQRRTADGDGRHHYQRVRQTAIVSHDPELELPEFRLAPRAKGITAGLMSMLGGMGDINFDDSPTFSKEYFLHGWAEEPVRLLFNEQLRGQFAENLGWSVIGKGDALVVFRHNQVIDGDIERQKFTQEGLALLASFQQAEEALDAQPSLRRETTAEDLLTTADRMGGLAGAMLTRQLQKIGVTRKQIDAFVAESKPRDIPPGMKRQVLGDNLPLVFAGLMFIVIGLGIGIGLLLFKSDEIPWFAYLFPIVQPFVGAVILFFTLRHRNRKRRTLQHGELVEAKVVGIQSTETTVNDQRRFKVTVEYADRDKVIRKDMNAYGGSVDLARKCQDEDRPIRILIDPQDPDHVVGIDMLLVFQK
ncbi:MAG: DUF3592 domain-containing protein [Rubripirellula sp.]